MLKTQYNDSFVEADLSSSEVFPTWKSMLNVIKVRFDLGHPTKI